MRRRTPGLRPERVRELERLGIAPIPLVRQVAGARVRGIRRRSFAEFAVVLSRRGVRRVCRRFDDAVALPSSPRRSRL